MSHDEGKELDEIRGRIDALDRMLVETLAKRQHAVDELTRLKAAGALALHDPGREDALLARAGELAAQLGLSGYFVRAVYRAILDHSLRRQHQHLIDVHNPVAREKRRAVVSFQGADGAYSQIAAERYFSSWDGEIETRGYGSFLGLLQAVANGAADYGMLPVENTTAGSINEAYDLLAQTSLAVVGEEVLRVEHCLVGMPGAKLAEIRRVYSHPQALAQCSVFLGGLEDCAVQSFTDTAMSVKKVRDEGDASQAAVASERAAALYGLHVLARNIENQKDNYTRFMVVARTPLRLDERIACKTSLIFSTRHEQGALVRCLNVLADQGLNLTKLESRPRPASPFEYIFYVDFEGNVESETVQRALSEMRAHTSSLKVLGSYPRAGK
jgi:chorismate mutase / prephenate dehydratase